MGDGYLAAGIFVCFMLLSALTVLNMLIGVLCEVVTAVGQHERDEADTALVKMGILKELLKFDVDGDGTISQVELEHVMSSQEAQVVLDALEVDTATLDEIHAMLFKDQSDKVTIRQIMESCLSYRGSQPTTVKHLVDGMVFNRHYTEQVVKDSMKDITRTVIRQNEALIKVLETHLTKPEPAEEKLANWQGQSYVIMEAHKLDVL